MEEVEKLTYRIKRLFMGRWASVRDYIVNRCISGGLTLRIVYGKDSIDIPPGELSQRGFQGIPKQFKSKFGKNSYQLIDFVWKADTKGMGC